MHASIIYVRIVLVGFERYWSVLRGTGQGAGRFEPLLTSLGRTSNPVIIRIMNANWYVPIIVPSDSIDSAIYCDST